MQDSPTGQLVFVDASDGVRLATTLYLPPGDGPFATLVEALPYRMNDVTASYEASYHRLVVEGGFAVVRVDLRGTGSSAGLATDEYPDVERTDLRTVIEWAAAQPWSNGAVGMFGTSYSGFNSLHLAMEGIHQLKAIAPMYATDDRYTDDVHYMGGVLRALDLIDYPLYMVAMNALPPVPAVWAQGNDTPWRDEWQRRLDEHEPWLLTWLDHSLGDGTWRRGSVRLGPGGEGYERFSCPVLLIAGWADGYRNNTFRAIEHMVDWWLLAGPWSHKDPTTARPGPNIDLDHELIRFFDEHLRGGPPASTHRGRVFVRRSTPPEPDLALHDGEWVGIDQWPVPGAGVLTWSPPAERDEIDALDVRGDVGVMAWNSCAGGLPWGQPLDQRPDDARSITYDWVEPPAAAIAGNPEVRLRVQSSAPVGHVSVKLCDVAPDGTSTLITRGMLDLAHRGVWPVDGWGTPGAPLQPVTPGEWIDVRIAFEATTWTLVPGHRLRLVVNGVDWPNCWPPAQPFRLSVERRSVQLTVPTVPTLPDGGSEFVPGNGPGEHDADGVVWRYEHDVLRQETRVHTRYGGPYEGSHGTHVVDVYEGSLGISTVDLSRGWATGRSRFELTFPEHGACTTEATLDVRSDPDGFDVRIDLTATHDGAEVAHRTWTRRLPR